MKISKLTRETFNLKKKEALITQALCDAARNGIDDSEIIFKSAIENNNCLSIEACLHELALEERDLISFGTAISAARRGSEIIDSHRLCAAVLFINTPNMHSTKKELSKETIDHLKKINIFCSNKLFKFEQLYNLSYNSRLNLHINLIKNNEIIPDYDFDIPDVGPWCGVRIIVFSIKGKKDFWDENSKENIQLALASVLEILAKEKYITPTLTNTFGKALDQADESMLPISFLISAAQASNLSFSNINDLALENNWISNEVYEKVKLESEEDLKLLESNLELSVFRFSFSVLFCC